MADHVVRTQGRPREFSVDDAIDSALDLFWENGFRATTTRELETALGIGQSSIYNAFGSKRELLLAAIDQYEQRVQQELLGILAGPGDGLEVLDEFFRELGRWIERTDHRGCLVVNLMAAETDDPAIKERVVAYRTTIRSALAVALARSFDESTAEAKAGMLLATVLGLHITARTGQEGEVAGMIAAVTAELDTWRATAADR
jgi:TetR/AcrR family transcriptional repressor of nem operon